MRLGQNGRRSDVWLMCPGTLTKNRRWIDSTLPTISPWNSVNPLASWEDWDQIPWSELHDNVRRLQIRIAKATREQDWRRVKALQRLLVNSFSAKALAVKRGSENDGKRTPGVDGEKWNTPGAKWQAIQRLSSRGLRPQPLRRVYIPKRGSTKMRPLGIPTMIIRAQQALHLQGLEEVRPEPHATPFGGVD